MKRRDPWWKVWGGGGGGSAVLYRFHKCLVWTSNFSLAHFKISILFYYCWGRLCFSKNQESDSINGVRLVTYRKYSTCWDNWTLAPMELKYTPTSELQEMDPSSSEDDKIIDDIKNCEHFHQYPSSPKLKLSLINLAWNTHENLILDPNFQTLKFCESIFYINDAHPSTK